MVGPPSAANAPTGGAASTVIPTSTGCSSGGAPILAVSGRPRSSGSARGSDDAGRVSWSALDAEDGRGVSVSVVVDRPRRSATGPGPGSAVAAEPTGAVGAAAAAAAAAEPTGSAAAAGLPPEGVRTNPRAGTTPERRSDRGCTRTGPSPSLPIVTCSKGSGTTWSTQVSAWRPESRLVVPESTTSAHTAPRRKTTTPSSTGATSPNADSFTGVRPLTQPASRAAIAAPGRPVPDAAASTRSRSSAVGTSSAAVSGATRTTAS